MRNVAHLIGDYLLVHVCLTLFGYGLSDVFQLSLLLKVTRASIPSEASEAPQIKWTEQIVLVVQSLLNALKDIPQVRSHVLVGITAILHCIPVLFLYGLAYLWVDMRVKCLNKCNACIYERRESLRQSVFDDTVHRSIWTR